MQPIGHFAEIWRLDDPGLTLVDADAAHLLVQRYHDGGWQLALHAIADGRELGRARTHRGAWSARSVSPALVDPRTVLALVDADLVALDVPTLRERWRTPAVPYFDFIGQRRAAQGRVLLQPNLHGALLRDLATGRELWRHEQRSAVDAPSLFDEHRVYFHDLHHFIVALDLADARPRWRHDLPGKSWDAHWQTILLGDTLLAVGAEVLRLDRATGRLLSRYPAGAHPQEFHHLAARDGVLYLSSIGGTEALDAATGAALWSTPWPIGAPLLADDAIVGCGAGTIVRALDRATGTEAWRHGLERCVDPWPSDHAWLQLASGTSRGDILVLRTGAGLVAHARVAPAPAPAEDVTIRGSTILNGRRRGNVEVHVGDRVVRSDRRGNFSATLPGMRGVVSVEITADEAKRVTRQPCGNEESKGVPLTGAGLYTVDATAHAQDYECDQACRCD